MSAGNDCIHAPWTEEEIAALQRYQLREDFHPYMCRDSSHGPLLATRLGWLCLTCDYSQSWALRSSLAMADAPPALGYVP